jgi:transposase-like protein
MPDYLGTKVWEDLMAKRKRFTPEFKREAVRTMVSSDKSPADIARELGVHRNQLYKWKEQFGNGATHSAKGNGRSGGTDELSRLRHELEVVKEERDILKKAMVYFARELHS